MHIKLLTFFLLLGCTLENNDTLKVAVIDTEFCLKNISVNSKIDLRDQYDSVTKTKSSTSCNFQLGTKQFHGHFVLQTLLDSIGEISKPITIFPINVFTKEGRQDDDSWKNAFKYVDENEIDLVVMASSYLSFGEKKIDLKLGNHLYIVAAGTKKPEWDTVPTLWPQSVDSELITKIGHYFPTKMVTNSNHGFFDTSIIDQTSVDYYIEAANSTDMALSGTSYATAVASGRIIKKCYQKLIIRDSKSLKKCTNNNSTEHQISSRKVRILLP